MEKKYSGHFILFKNSKTHNESFTIAKIKRDVTPFEVAHLSVVDLSWRFLGWLKNSVKKSSS